MVTEAKTMAIRAGTFSYTTLQYTYSDSRVIPHSGLLIPGQMLQAINFDAIVNHSISGKKEFQNSDILKAFLICVLLGEPDYETIHETDDDPEFYCQAFRMRKIPSEATLRQRMDDIGASLKHPLRKVNVALFTHYGITPGALENGYIPIDIDVSPFINEKCSKEGISRTYHGKDGYAPMFAYIGTEGYMLACELRIGKQHCQNGTLAFLREVIDLARQITDKPLLIRMDAGNDAAENIGLCMEESFKGNRVHFLIKRNLRKESAQDWLTHVQDVCQKVTEPREGKKVYLGETFRQVSYQVPDTNSKSGFSNKSVGIRTIYEITERACDHDGQYYITPKVVCDMYSVSVDFPDEEILELYHKHGEMEQYHSEIKTDLNAEQLPSGKFATNELVLELVQLAYNLMRIMGQTSLEIPDIPMKRPVKRRRLRTVLQKLILCPGILISHARQLRLDLGHSNPWRKALSTLWDKLNKKAVR